MCVSVCVCLHVCACGIKFCIQVYVNYTACVESRGITNVVYPLAATPSGK